MCAFKPQFAHFAAAGREQELREVCRYVRAEYPEHVLILDAKRGDVGSTSSYYAREAFEQYDAHAVTVSPYLGFDGVEPFLAYPDRGVILLCRTSNPGSDWLQRSEQDDIPVYQRVAQAAAAWPSQGQLMLVAGATYPEELGEIRRAIGDMPLLVPGIGAQGGDLQGVLANGLTDAGTGLVISSSRGIIYASDGADFAAAAAAAASSLKASINEYRIDVKLTS